jgi:hypothetical protein
MNGYIKKGIANVCIVKKRKVWCCWSICRDIKRILAFELGCRGLKTGKKVWENQIHPLPTLLYRPLGSVSKIASS